MSSLRGVVILLAAGCLLAGPAAAETIEKRFQENFDVDENSRLVLSFGDGDVTVVPWDRAQLEVTIDYEADCKKIGAGRRPGFEADFNERGDTIEVMAHETGGGGIGFFSRDVDRFDIAIRAPEWLALEIVGDDGNVHIEKWRGNLECLADDGEVVLRDIEADEITVVVEDGDLMGTGLRGRLDLRAEDGEIRIEDCETEICRLEVEDGDIRVIDCAGDFDVRTEDGRAELLDLRCGTVSIETDDGDIDLEIIRADDLDITIESEDGDIAVTLPGDVSAEFEITTDDGAIDVDRAIGAERDREHLASGTIGDGNGRIEIDTEDGDVRLDLDR